MNITTTLIVAAIAFLVAVLAFRPALWFAKRYNIVDNPDARKLQKEPVPVFGGIVMLCGILTALQYTRFVLNDYAYDYISIMMITLWAIGVADDIKGLSASLRFIIELGLIWLMIWYPNSDSYGVMINSFLGLFGIQQLSPAAAIPLTLIAGVGIINSINLIDGVDGYSSGFGIITNAILAYIFYCMGDMRMVVFCTIISASLIPFWFHNVFGHKTKMFLGDGGSLVLGMALAYAVFHLLGDSERTRALQEQQVGFVALSLAVLCVPVCDTLRVMTARLLHNQSPFHPDKTHYHHLLLRYGFSHLATSSTLIAFNTLVICAWWIAWQAGANIHMQTCIVIALGLLFVCSYYILDKHNK